MSVGWNTDVAGFDDIDRKYRPKEPIKLECVDCGSTQDVVTRNMPKDEKIPLCYKCYGIRWNNL